VAIRVFDVWESPILGKDEARKTAEEMDREHKERHGRKKHTF